ncbi:MAG TPA: DUF4142 domain-containing protein [Chitinophagaceae bacterium]|nr:DUF4142 domain-containing protein [Chitinophagaceae bacterium]
MKKLLLAAVVVAATIVSLSFISTSKASDDTASCYSNASGALIEPDSVFVMESASSGMMEVQLGNQAQQKAMSQRVKDFGAMMVRDHTKANEELKAIATAKNYRMPDSLMPKHRRHVDHLNGLTGEEFDREYIRMMVEAHKDDIDEFEDASKKAKDADVKAFAAKNLPILRMHRDSATAIRRTLRGNR